MYSQTALQQATSVFTPPRDHGYVAIIGFTPDHPASANYRTIWTKSADSGIDFKNSPVEMFIASTNVGDSGIVLINGIKTADYEFASERHNLNGQTPVSIGAWLHPQLIQCVTPTVGEVYCGLGTFTLGVPSDPQNHIGKLAGEPFNAGISKQAAFTVPKGKRFLINSTAYHTSSIGDMITEIVVPGYAPIQSFHFLLNENSPLLVPASALVGGLAHEPDGLPVYFGPGTRIVVKGKTAVGQGAMSTVTQGFLITESNPS